MLFLGTLDVAVFSSSRWHRFLAQNPTADWSEVPGLPIKSRALLQSSFVCSTSSVESCQTSLDGETTKLLIRLQDGLQIESVIMYYDTSGMWRHIRGHLNFLTGWTG